MADHEISKLMWIAVAVALSASIYFIARPQINTLAGTTFDNVGKVVKGIQLPSGDDGNGGETVPDNGRPNPDDPKWVVKGNYGTNGYYVQDKDGTAIVYALDETKPITVNTAQSQTTNNASLKALTFLDPVTASGNIQSFFSKNSLLMSITGLDKWNVSDVTNLNSLFMDSSALQSLDLSSWNTSKVTSLQHIFDGTKALTSLNITGWDTSNVIYMNQMFANTRKLQSITGFSSISTKSATDLTEMFRMATAIKSLDVSNWDTSKVTSMKSLFANTLSLSNLIGLDNWNTSNVTDMSSMFSNTLLGSINLSKWNTSNVINMSYMFNNSTQLESVGDLSNWTVKQVTNMSNMYDGTRIDDAPSWYTQP